MINECLGVCQKTDSERIGPNRLQGACSVLVRGWRPRPDWTWTLHVACYSWDILSRQIPVHTEWSFVSSRHRHSWIQKRNSQWRNI
jgi:hypothetical protein